MASYPASRGTNTTRTGNYYSTNPNQPVADIQRVGMNFTAEMMAKEGGVGWSYLRVRANYCRPIGFRPKTGNPALNDRIKNYCKKVWANMGVGGCSMWSAVARTVHIETPIRGDAGLIFHRDRMGRLRLLEWSADMLGEPLFFVNPKRCSLAVDLDGNIKEVPGRNLMYYAGRYFDGPDCVAYKIFQRNAAGFWSDPIIYSASDVIYCVDPLNFRSMRGVTIFAQALQYMQKSESMLQSAVDTGIRQSREFGQVYNNSGQPNGPVQYEEPGFTWENAAVTLFQKAPNGPFERYLFNGDKAEFQAPTHPGGNIIDGVDAADEKALTALGLTWGFVMSYEKLGGAPSRLDADRNGKEIIRIEDDISTPIIMRIVDATIKEGINEGAIDDDPDIYDEFWQVKGDVVYTTSATADGFKDSQANIKESRAGQTSDTVVASQYNLNIDDLIKDKEDEAVKRAVALKNAKDRARAEGVEELDLPTKADIAAASDNPQQAQAAEQLEQGKPASGEDKTIAKMALALLAADHDVTGEPRDDSGKWTSGGGSGSKALVPTKAVPHESGKGMKLVHPQNGADIPAHIKALKLPPAWTDVKINPDPNADLLAQGKDAKGRLQSVYSDSHNMRTAAAKFSRIRELIQKRDKIFAQNAANLKSDDPIIRENAAVSALIHSTGIRPGSDTDTGAKKKAYGATTLLGQHVTTDSEGNVVLKFTGKKGVDLSIPVTDSQVADILKERAAKAGPDGKLFNTDDSKLRDYTHTLDGGGFKTKDFRTLKGTSIAIEQIKMLPKPTNEKEYKEAVKKVATVVSQTLGNTPVITLQAYIDPTVFSGWQDFKKAA
jgi:DNA topoisomerase-1